MNWKKLWWIFPLSAAVAVFVGYWMFALQAFTPEMSREVAVASGLRPAAHPARDPHDPCDGPDRGHADPDGGAVPLSAGV